MPNLEELQQYRGVARKRQEPGKRHRTRAHSILILKLEAHPSHSEDMFEVYAIIAQTCPRMSF